MKVKYVIEKLSTFDPEMEVEISTQYENYYIDDIILVKNFIIIRAD